MHWDEEFIRLAPEKQVKWNGNVWITDRIEIDISLKRTLNCFSSTHLKFKLIIQFSIWYCLKGEMGKFHARLQSFTQIHLPRMWKMYILEKYIAIVQQKQRHFGLGKLFYLIVLIHKFKTFVLPIIEPQ